jgi:hypothetical protein
MVDGGFTKEQLAIAKQLQAGYYSSGTFKAPTTGVRPVPQQQVGRRSASAAPPVRMPPAQPARPQPGSALRSSNGLVRPLPSGGQCFLDALSLLIYTHPFCHLIFVLSLFIFVSPFHSLFFTKETSNCLKTSLSNALIIRLFALVICVFRSIF